MRQFLTGLALTWGIAFAAAPATAAPVAIAPFVPIVAPELQSVRLICREECGYAGCRRVCRDVHRRHDWDEDRDYGGRSRYYDGGRSRYEPRRRSNTWNGCPPRWTVQDGVCKPYTGR